MRPRTSSDDGDGERVVKTIVPFRELSEKDTLTRGIRIWTKSVLYRMKNGREEEDEVKRK